jgi:microcystin-dependent protein
MSRVKTFVATGVAPDGKLYAGDLNAIEDHFADLSNFTQTVDMATLRIGDTSLSLVKYGTGEGRWTGALRFDGIVRSLGGDITGAFTTTARDSIPTTLAPYGLRILNTTTNRYEWNSGTDVARNWQPLGASVSETSRSDLLANIPAASSVAAGTLYYATDTDVFYRSTGVAWVRIGSQAGDLFWTFNGAASVGRVLLQGQTVPRTGIYADLFAKWATTFNTGGEAGTDFRLPDARGRALVAVGTNAAINTMGGNDGLLVANRRGLLHRHTPHTHVNPAHSHTVSDPGHAHAVYDPGHSHFYTSPAIENWQTPSFSPADWYHTATGAFTALAVTNIGIYAALTNLGIVGNAVTINTADGGSGVGTDPLDRGAFITANLEAKL